MREFPCGIEKPICGIWGRGQDLSNGYRLVVNCCGIMKGTSRVHLEVVCEVSRLPKSDDDEKLKYRCFVRM